MLTLLLQELSMLDNVMYSKTNFHFTFSIDCFRDKKYLRQKKYIT